MKVKEWKSIRFESDCCRTRQYINFENQCKRELKKQLELYGINLHSFHPNHFEWSAVLERNGRFVYVHMSDVRWGNWYTEILIRTMAHDKDWTGGPNEYCSFDQIGSKADRMLFGRC